MIHEETLSCYLCGSGEHTKRQGSVRDNKSIDVLECLHCGLVFLSSFNHISDVFYEDSGMHDSSVDLAMWQRDTALDDERRIQTLRGAIVNKNILDFGCGNGGFLIRAREIARSVAGIELENSYKTWFKENGIPISSLLDDVTGRFDVITLFHVLEHLADPRTMLISLSQRLENGGQLIVEVPSTSDALLSLYDCEAYKHFTYWSCHLYLFNQLTLDTLAKQAGLQVNYIKQVQRYPLSNHLHWLAREKPGGHKCWNFIDSPELHAAYEKQLASIGACDTIIASLYIPQSY